MGKCLVNECDFILPYNVLHIMKHAFLLLLFPLKSLTYTFVAVTILDHNNIENLLFKSILYQLDRSQNAQSGAHSVDFHTCSFKIGTNNSQYSKLYVGHEIVVHELYRDPTVWPSLQCALHVSSLYFKKQLYDIPLIFFNPNLFLVSNVLFDYIDIEFGNLKIEFLCSSSSDYEKDEGLCNMADIFMIKSSLSFPLVTYMNATILKGVSRKEVFYEGLGKLTKQIGFLDSIHIIRPSQYHWPLRFESDACMIEFDSANLILAVNKEFCIVKVHIEVMKYTNTFVFLMKFSPLPYPLSPPFFSSILVELLSVTGHNH